MAVFSPVSYVGRNLLGKYEEDGRLGSREVAARSFSGCYFVQVCRFISLLAQDGGCGGAVRSTLMKLLSIYLRPLSGIASIL